MALDKNISVLIPTCNRPRLLETALRSVEEQTAKARVSEVVVIENGGAHESRRVCEQFSALPIRYVFRDPPLPPENATRPALSEVRGEFVAFLCDDDWWTKYHLESAFQALETNRDAVAHFSNALFTQGQENCYIDHIYHSWLPWFATKGKCKNGLHVLSATDMLVATLIATPFHVSSMIISRTAWVKSLRAFEYGNPFDTDRMLEFEVTKHGAVLFQSHPSIYVRMHRGQEVKRLGESGEAEKWFNDTTRRILALARDAGIDVKKEFAERFAATGNNFPRLREYSIFGSVDFLESEGFVPPLGEADQTLRYEAIIADLQKREASTQNDIESIMKSKTFRLGRALSKFKSRILKGNRC